MIEKLITEILKIVNIYGGSFYTSTRLRDNPDVCHAACLWFLAYARRHGFYEALTQLSSMDKETLRQTQKGVLIGTSIPRAMVTTVRSSGLVISDRDIEALQYVLNAWEQPRLYSENIQNVVQEIIRVMRANADRLLIYMLPGRGGTGHVICLTRNVGGLAIYDPNMGIIILQLSKTDVWGSILTMILQWYRDNMALSRFGFR